MVSVEDVVDDTEQHPRRSRSLREQTLLASIELATREQQALGDRLRTHIVDQTGRVYTRVQLLDAIHDAAHVVSDRTVDSHINNLRRKLTDAGLPNPLAAVYGIGYRFQ
ncbi:MAG: hypothetical protein OMOMHJEC_02934 [Xanthomonadales bacterium]|nr:hypothetical protein [Xanthomonadales bacterium]